MNYTTESIEIAATTASIQSKQSYATASDISTTKGFLIAQLVLVVILLLIVVLIVYLVNKLGVQMTNQYNSYRFYNHVISPPKRITAKSEIKPSSSNSNNSVSKQYDQRPSTSYYVDYEATPTTNKNNIEYDDPLHIEANFQYPVTSSGARRKLKYGQTETIKQKIKMKRSQSWDVNNNQLCKDFSLQTINNRTNDFIVGIDEEDF